MTKNLLHIFLVFTLLGFFLNTAPQNAQALDTKNPMPPAEAKAKLDKLVTQGIITNEQAGKVTQDLNSGKSPDPKSQIDNWLSADILNEPQALTVIHSIFKTMPEGIPDFPDTAAVYTQNSKIVSKTKQSYIGSRQNESGVIVSTKGLLTLTNSSIMTSGSTSVESISNFYGLNSGILAQSASTIHLSDSIINTTGDGATAVFATGTNSLITLANVKIHTSGDSSCGLAATIQGAIQAENIDIATFGDRAPALATDRVNGSVLVHGAVLKTAGKDSPGIYSIGNIAISDASIAAESSEAAVIEGRNSLTLTNTTISGAKQWGVLLFQGYSGNLEAGASKFTMHGGSLTALSGSAFFVTNIEGNIELIDAAINAPSQKLLEVAAGKWGTKGGNGGKLTFTATREKLAGSIFCDNISTLTVSLKDNTTLTSTINSVRTSGFVHLILDNSSTWNVTGTSYLSSLANTDSTLSNIHDNGFTVYYEPRLAANQWLQGKTYPLRNGGNLTPIE